MTPKEHDIPEASEELTTTEIYPFASGFSPETDRAPDDTLPDVPVMEQLPDPDALPDPGYPVMPPPGPPVSGPPDGPGARSWPRPPVWPPVVPTFTPARPEEPPPPKAEAVKEIWSPDPYAAPRLPDDAPPLRGPSVPWSEVRAAADHEAAGETLAAPPALHPAAADPAAANAVRAVEMPPEEPVR